MCRQTPGATEDRAVEANDADAPDVHGSERPAGDGVVVTGAAATGVLAIIVVVTGGEGTGVGAATGKTALFVPAAFPPLPERERVAAEALVKASGRGRVIHSHTPHPTNGVASGLPFSTT